VRKALASLPGVEKDSIQVDVSKKEAKFKVAKFDEEATKKAVEDAGNFKVSAVKKEPAK
jgi:copper chaperone CopZ